MAEDILLKIVEGRKAAIKEKGLSFGYEIPSERERPLHPFVQKKGVVLEVKRASPSKGNIAPGLDAKKTALCYQEAGAAAVSVLTEENYFKGNLGDLISVCRGVDIAVLRKDFLIFPEEIDVAYKCGADAVLLIARILDKETLAKMLERTASFGMTAFVELRLEEDLQKLLDAMEVAGKNLPQIVCGVNARDLKDFSIDLLAPCGFLGEIKAALGNSCSVVFESGIRTATAAFFAGSLGFEGLLLGEAAARDLGKARELVSSFVNAGKNDNGAFWISFSKKVRERKVAAAKSEGSEKKAGRPFVKICGLTNFEDAALAADLGADLLGFVLCASSPRNAEENVVREVRAALRDKKLRHKSASEASRRSARNNDCGFAFDDTSGPLFVGVVTELSSPQGKAAVRLVKEGILDCLQLHGKTAASEFFSDSKYSCLPHYCAANLQDGGGLEEVQGLLNLGESRILVDAKVGSAVGGTGTQVPENLVLAAAKKAPLWLAGGLGPDNVRLAIEKFKPELIDASSLLEAAPGKKDEKKLRAFFSEVGAAAF